jgi:hypothetical protein
MGTDMFILTNTAIGMTIITMMCMNMRNSMSGIKEVQVELDIMQRKQSHG